MVTKKVGRPSKKRLLANDVDALELDFFDWKCSEVQDLFVIGDPFLPTVPLPNSDFLMSLLLSKEGAPVFVAKAKEIAFSIGLDLSGLLWVLVHHQETELDISSADLMDSWVIVAHDSVLTKDACGKSLATIVKGDSKDRACIVSSFQKVLRGTVGQCSIGTVMMNVTVIRGNGEKICIRNAYIFYDQASL